MLNSWLNTGQGKLNIWPTIQILELYTLVPHFNTDFGVNS